MAADGHLGMMALSRVTLASAGLSCSGYYNKFECTMDPERVCPAVVGAGLVYHDRSSTNNMLDRGSRCYKLPRAVHMCIITN